METVIVINLYAIGIFGLLALLSWLAGKLGVSVPVPMTVAAASVVGLVGAATLWALFTVGFLVYVAVSDF